MCGFPCLWVRVSLRNAACVLCTCAVNEVATIDGVLTEYQCVRELGCEGEE